MTYNIRSLQAKASSEWLPLVQLGRGGGLESFMWVFDCQGIHIPNPTIVQGSPVLCLHGDTLSYVDSIKTELDIICAVCSQVAY